MSEKVSRKNRQFGRIKDVRFMEAGKHNALLYTLIENCKLQHFDPKLYLAGVIKALPEHPTAEQAANQLCHVPCKCPSELVRSVLAVDLDSMVRQRQNEERIPIFNKIYDRDCIFATLRMQYFLSP